MRMPQVRLHLPQRCAVAHLRSDSSSSSSSPSTPEQSLLLSPSTLKNLFLTPGRAAVASSPLPSTPLPRASAATPQGRSLLAVPQSEVSIARNIPLPASPYPEPLPPSDVSIACNMPLPASPFLEVPPSELSIARNIPLPLSPLVLKSALEECNMVTDFSVGDTESAQQAEAGGLNGDSGAAAPEAGEDSVEMGRGGPSLREALAASPGSRYVSVYQETSVDWLVPITGDDSISISVPRPPSALGSDVSMSSFLNAIFPSPASLHTDSTESLDILRTPAPPSDPSGSSSDLAVPTVAELLQQTAFTFAFPPHELRRAPTPSADDDGAPALRLSEVLRPEAYLPSLQASDITAIQAAGGAPLSRPTSALVDRLLGGSTSPRKPTFFVGNTAAAAQEDIAAPLAADTTSSINPVQAHPSTPQTTAPGIAGARKPKYSRKSTRGAKDVGGEKETHGREKEDKRRKRRDDAKDLTKLQDKENATPDTSRSTRSAASKSVELSSKLASAVAATTAVSRSPLKATNNTAMAQTSPTKPPSPKRSNPTASVKSAPASKLPTASFPKRSGLPVPSGISRSTASKLPVPGSLLKSTASFKASAPVMPALQRASTAVSTNGSPSRSMFTSGVSQLITLC
ncbi:hypothetical protein CALCODRAFT_18429 [Calocera cornea HHB12733]|uniref:Uncharacterized protein n=1 Tax=Calocera cornea HHB12733 TaxID=1353952 RepID=A0A165E8H1_9BASI|nr:hypothetical protein CALCODRAFT_18429 [Calocera cornea HHB12733]